MRAVRWHGRLDVRLDDVPEPVLLSEAEALVRVAYCGICGTDLHEYADGPVMIRSDRPHPLTGATAPVTLGHELSGWVVALGRPVAGVVEGDLVAVDPCWRCNTCFWCARGEYNICRLGGSIGLASDGGLADLVRVPIEGLVPVPDGVTPRQAALAEPAAVGIHAVRRAGVGNGERVVVLGAGPIGLVTANAARLAGADLVVVSEPNPRRRELAARIGADVVLDPREADLRSVLAKATDRVGADVVFECTGNAEILTAAVPLARRGGRIVEVGVGAGTAAVGQRDLVLYERTLLGSLGYAGDLDTAVAQMADGSLDADLLISEEHELEELPAALESMTRKPPIAKTLVRVSGAG